MSRIGFKPIPLPDGVSVEIKEHEVTVKGPKGEVSVHVPGDVSVLQEENILHIKPKNGVVEDPKLESRNHGTTAANLHNAVAGVKDGWKKELELSGTGYRAQMKGASVNMFLGYSHNIEVAPIGKYTKISCPDETHIVVEGVSRQEVGETAARIYDSHRPDVYGNKGVHYKGQHMIKKVGKRAASGAKK